VSAESDARAKIVDRVLKLRNLARGASNEHERRAAAKRALDLMHQHGLTDADLDGAGKPQAFDKLVDLLGTYAAGHPDLAKSPFGAAKIIQDTLGHAKGNLSQGRKIALLDQVSRGLEVAKMFLGEDNRTLNDLSGIVEGVLRSCQ